MSIKKPLDVFVYLDLRNSKNDYNLLYRCIQVYFKVHLKQYELVNFKIISENHLHKITQQKFDITQNLDVIQQSLVNIKQIINNEKLKTTNECWFLLISNGNIKNIYKNVSLFLINKNPQKKECFYTIHKNQLYIDNKLSKIEKLDSLKILTSSLNELLQSNKQIRYH